MKTRLAVLLGRCLGNRRLPPDQSRERFRFLTRRARSEGGGVPWYAAQPSEDRNAVRERKIPAIRQAGRHFHLGAIFDRINRDYFEGEVTAAITWGRRSARRRRRSIRLGSYRREQNLIRINPTLDAGFIPPSVVEALVHHEMLHAVIPVRTGENGRRIVHGRDFQAREREYYGYLEAKKWTRENLGLLLRQDRSRPSRGGAHPPLPQRSGRGSRGTAL